MKRRWELVANPSIHSQKSSEHRFLNAPGAAGDLIEKYPDTFCCDDPFLVGGADDLVVPVPANGTMFTCPGTDQEFIAQHGRVQVIDLMAAYHPDHFFFLITDEDENLGPIEEVIEQPHQVLLRISLDGKEALIPLHAESLDRIDHKKKQVYVILPDGLLDIYR